MFAKTCRLCTEYLYRTWHVSFADAGASQHIKLHSTGLLDAHICDPTQYYKDSLLLVAGNSIVLIVLDVLDAVPEGPATKLDAVPEGPATKTFPPVRTSSLSWFPDDIATQRCPGASEANTPKPRSAYDNNIITNTSFIAKPRYPRQLLTQ